MKFTLMSLLCLILPLVYATSSYDEAVNQCVYLLPEMFVPDTNSDNPCDVSGVLDAGDTCDIDCGEDWSGHAGTLSCPDDAYDGQYALSSTVCTASAADCHDYQFDSLEDHENLETDCAVLADDSADLGCDAYIESTQYEGMIAYPVDVLCCATCTGIDPCIDLTSTIECLAAIAIYGCDGYLPSAGYEAEHEVTEVDVDEPVTSVCCTTCRAMKDGVFGVNQCVYSLPDGVVPDTDSDTPCWTSGVLTAGTSCNITCDEDWYGDAGTFSCPSDADDGQEATTSTICSDTMEEGDASMEEGDVSMEEGDALTTEEDGDASMEVGDALTTEEDEDSSQVKKKKKQKNQKKKKKKNKKKKKKSMDLLDATSAASDVEATSGSYDVDETAAQSEADQAAEDAYSDATSAAGDADEAAEDATSAADDVDDTAAQSEADQAAEDAYSAMEEGDASMEEGDALVLQGEKQKKKKKNKKQDKKTRNKKQDKGDALTTEEDEPQEVESESVQIYHVLLIVFMIVALLALVFCVHKLSKINIIPTAYYYFQLFKGSGWEKVEDNDETRKNSYGAAEENSIINVKEKI